MHSLQLAGMEIARDESRKHEASAGEVRRFTGRLNPAEFSVV